MKTEKMKVLLYLKKSGLDKSGKAPIMGRITIGRSIAQFSCKLSCNPGLWNSRESRMDGKSGEAVEINGRLENLLLSIQSAYQSLIAKGQPFDATDVKEREFDISSMQLPCFYQLSLCSFLASLATDCMQ